MGPADILVFFRKTVVNASVVRAGQGRGAKLAIYNARTVASSTTSMSRAVGIA